MKKSIAVPNNFSFRGRTIGDFEKALEVFDWDIQDTQIAIDFSSVRNANYQTLALFALFAWHLRLQRCRIDFKFGPNSGIGKMWYRMGLPGWSQVLFAEEDFKHHPYKPLIAIRSQHGFNLALGAAEAFAESFDVEYQKTLRYVLSELLYNTLEHGYCLRKTHEKELRVPSIVQFTWYRRRNELQFVVADIGMGIKTHLEHAYEPFENHMSAIRTALRPNTSGTFSGGDPYQSKDNAGVGLYISSNIIQRLNADMYVCSGNGLVHVSPRDITGRTIGASWPGTLVLISLRLGQIRHLRLQALMHEFRKAASQEIEVAEKSEAEGREYLHVQNYFGAYAEDKELAIKIRDAKIVPAIESGKQIVIDLAGVVSAPHSFLSSLMADPIRRSGVAAYKQLKFVNADPVIRETVDYILDENTAMPGAD